MGDDDMPIHSEHMTELDCTDEDNRIQARFELDRADETRTPAAMASWGAKWGRSLLSAADSLGDDADQLERVQKELHSAEDGAREVDARNAELMNAIKSAIETLEEAKS